MEKLKLLIKEQIKKALKENLNSKIRLGEKILLISEYGQEYVKVYSLKLKNGKEYWVDTHSKLSKELKGWDLDDIDYIDIGKHRKDRTTMYISNNNGKYFSKPPFNAEIQPTNKPGLGPKEISWYNLEKDWW